MNLDISLKEAIFIILGTYPFALVAPSFSSDFFRAVPLQKRIRMSKVVGTCFTERFFDFLILFFLFFIGMILTVNFHFVILALIFLSILIIGVVLVNLKIRLPIGEKWHERLDNLFLSLRIMSSERSRLIPILIYSFLLWIITIIQMMILFESVGISIPLLNTIANLPIAIFIGQIPITFGGAGTRDAALIFLFSSFASTQNLLAVGILYTTMRCWIMAIIGIPFLKYIGLQNLNLTEKKNK